MTFAEFFGLMLGAAGVCCLVFGYWSALYWKD